MATSQKLLRCLFPLLVSTLAACTTSAPSRWSHTERAQLGTVGIVAARYEPELYFEGFAKGWRRGAGAGAVQGATGGAGQWLFQCTVESGFSLTPVCIGLTPIALVSGAMVGSVLGALWSTPKGQVETLETAINASQVRLEIQNMLRDRLSGLAQTETNYALLVVEGQGPVSADYSPDYGNLAGRNIDTVLEVGVLSAGTIADSRFPSRGFSITLAVQVRLIRTRDGEQLFSRVIKADSQVRDFDYWTTDNARRLIVAFEHIRDMATEQVLEDVFLVYQPLAARR